MTLHKAIEQFRERCAQNKWRATAPREYVFAIISTSQKPMTAYEVLDALGTHIEKPKPPTAYRALEFLTEHGLIHRIESLNAYVACAEDHTHKGSQFMICDSCGHVEEVHLCTMPAALEDHATGKGFTPSHWNAELHGICSKCI